MVLAHARTLHLSSLATRETDLTGLRITNEYADRASNTTRRLAKALDEHRRPSRSGAPFTAIQQANIAGQQVVMNGGPPPEKATNEQGYEAQESPSQTPSPLPAQPGGAGLPPGGDPANQAVGEIDRSTNARGQGAEFPERLEAR